jgi:hypothetical protein
MKAWSSGMRSAQHCVPACVEGATALRALVATILVTLTGLAFAAPSYAAIYRIPATIATDCSVDVTQQMQSFVGSVPDNSIVSFGSEACYRIDGTLELTGRNGLTFDGNGATFKATTTGDAWRSQWRVIDSSNFVFRNMTIRGANPNPGKFLYDLQWQFGIDLRGAAGVEVDRVSIINPYGDCVYIGQGWYGDTKAWTSDVHVHDSACAGPGRMGVAVTAGRNVLVETSNVSRIGLSAFDIEPDGAGFGAHNVTFTNNRVGSVYHYVFLAYGNGPVDDVTVSYNRLRGEGMRMAVLPTPGQRRSNVTIIGNVSETGYYEYNGAAMNFVRVDGLTVTGNAAPLSAPKMALASVSESCNVNISGNSFPGGVVEARISPYSCTTPSPTRNQSPTSTTLQVTRRGANAGSRRGSSARRAHGRVRGSRSGRVVIRLERIDRATRAWVKVKTRKPRVRRGRFATRLSGLESGRWRAQAKFRGNRNRAPSESSYRYFRVG